MINLCNTKSQDERKIRNRTKGKGRRLHTPASLGQSFQWLAGLLPFVKSTIIFLLFDVQLRRTPCCMCYICGILRVGIGVIKL